MDIETTIERIEILADHMDTVPGDEFNFCLWGQDGYKAGESCGAMGCAIGHATAMPYFKKLGLRLIGHGGHILPAYRDHVLKETITGVLGIQMVFGGTVKLMQRLFYPGAILCGNATPQEWATHARKIVTLLRLEHNIPIPIKPTVKEQKPFAVTMGKQQHERRLLTNRSV